jgi:hypothetical protein
LRLELIDQRNIDSTGIQEWIEFLRRFVDSVKELTDSDRGGSSCCDDILDSVSEESSLSEAYFHVNLESNTASNKA